MKKQIITALFLIFCSIGYPKNYCVTKTGNDNNAGTVSSPFLTITKGMNAATQAGDTVFVKAGTYAESVRFYASGTQEKSIVLKNYHNDNVIIDAQNTRFFCLYTNSQSYIVIDGIKVQNSTTYNVTVSGGSNILLKNIRSTLPLGKKTPHLEFPSSPKNVTLQNIITYGGSYGLYIDSEVDNINIISGEFSYALIDGISVYGSGTNTKNITIDGAYSHHNGRQGIDMAKCQFITVRNCHCSYNAASGIQIEAQGNNSLIENNLCEYNCRGGGYANSDFEAGIWIYNTDVSIVRNNTIRYNQTGLRFVQASNFQAYNNVISNNNYQPPAFPTTQNTSGVDFNTSSGAFYNNTLYGNSSLNSKLGSLYIYPNGISTLSIKNNVIMNDGGTKDMGMDQPIGSVVISDYNLVFNANRAVKIKMKASTYTWDFYKMVSGNDANSLNSDPKFLNISDEDYRLQSTSSAINAGENVGILTDHSDQPRHESYDIGAYKFNVTNSGESITKSSSK